jgi:hypothetical protein
MANISVMFVERVGYKLRAKDDEYRQKSVFAQDNVLILQHATKTNNIIAA